MAINKIIIENSSGNVGIGTTNPGARLHIAASGEGVLQIQDTDSANLNFFLGKNGAESYFLSRNGNANGHFAWYTSDGITTTARMRLTETGNVGIGTASVSQRLHVEGGSALIKNGENNVALWLGNSAYGFELEYSTGKIFTTINSNKRVTVDNSGNVGIGITSPTTSLHVVGDMRVGAGTTGGSAAGNLYIAGNRLWRWIAGFSPDYGVGNGFGLYDDTAGAYRLAVNTSGNVGIGTVSPVGKLHVAGPGNVTGGNIHMGDNTDAAAKWTYLTGAHYNGATNTTGISLIGCYSDSGSNRIVIGGDIYEANPATTITFFTHTATTHNLGGSEKMRITSSGDVGIGITNPGYKVHSTGTGRFGNILIGEGQYLNRIRPITDTNMNIDAPEGGIYFAPQSGVAVLNSSGSLLLGGYTNFHSAKLNVMGKIFIPHTTNSDIGGIIYAYNDTASYLYEGGLVFQSFFFNGSGYVMRDAVQINGRGHLLPANDNQHNLGSASRRWQHLYIGDLNLSNKHSQNDVDGTWGEWTIQEGETKLYLINKRNGKRYSFVLKEEE